MSEWRGVVSALVSLTAVCAVINGATQGFRAWTTDAARAVEVAEQPVRVPRPALVDESRMPQSIVADPRSTIVDFVYTRCPTMCGTLGATYQQLQADIARRGVASRVRLLTISFDPTWDTPERLQDYVIAMHPDPAIWTIATLTNTLQLAELLRTFGIRVIPDGADGFVHNAALHVVDPAGRLVAILPIDAPSAAIDLALAHAPTPGVMVLSPGTSAR